MPSEALQVREVDAYYGDSHVLQRVSFNLGEGRLLGLLGRNGAGKTTCLSAIVGLLAPRAGRIELFGRSIGGMRPEAVAAQGVALVPQGRRIFRNLTVRENLRVASRRRTNGTTISWTEDTVWQTFPRLAERRTQSAGVLSGGEQQMLAIGRALVSNPRVLLMDEPSEGLAPQIVAEVMQTIRRLKDQGLSIVLVEQNPKLILEIADDIVVLNSGRLAASDTAAAFRRNEQALHQHLGIF